MKTESWFWVIPHFLFLYHGLHSVTGTRHPSIFLRKTVMLRRNSTHWILDAGIKTCLTFKSCYAPKSRNRCSSVSLAKGLLWHEVIQTDAGTFWAPVSITMLLTVWEKWWIMLFEEQNKFFFFFFFLFSIILPVLNKVSKKVWLIHCKGLINDMPLYDG